MHKEEKRLTAINLLAIGLSQSEVSRKTGISRQLINSWMKNQDFQKQVLAKRQEVSENSLALTFTPDPTRTHHSDSTKTHHSDSTRTHHSELEMFRRQELQFLQSIEDSLRPLLAEGSVRAASTLLKLSEVRAKLLGLNRKTLPILDAVLLMLHEEILSDQQARMVFDSIEKLEKDLRIFDREQRNDYENIY